MSSRNRFFTLACLAVVLGFSFFTVVKIKEADVENLSAASWAINVGSYSVAENHISKVFLPTFRNDVNGLRAKILNEEASDTKVLSDLDRSASLLRQTSGDQDATRATPDAIIEGMTRSLSAAFSRPFVASLPAEKLNKRLASELPANVIVLVDDFHTKLHALRTVRFVMSYHAGSIGILDTPPGGCFHTPFRCRFFNETYNRLLLVSPVGSDYYGPRVTTLDNPNGIGTFQGARLVDWKNGSALSVAGQWASSFGGNSRATWFSSIRLSKDESPIIDDKRNPSLSGVSGILESEVNGVDGTDNGLGQNVFLECHICEHVTREIVAKWDPDEGVYLLQKSRIRPTPYVTIVSFIQEIYSFDESKYIASDVSEEAKTRLREFKRSVENQAPYNSENLGCLSGGSRRVGNHFESIISCPFSNGHVVYTLLEKESNGSYYLSDVRSS